jgi:leader peptidase (prepilin peptidase)/N-methyltransferase
MQSILALYENYPALLITVSTLLGLAVGSFLNVAAIRIPQGRSILHPPSQCANCRHRLGPTDLVPVFSFLWRRGRCHYCGSRFSSQYAVVEAITGIAYGLLAWHFGLIGELAVAWLLVSVLIVITLTDLRHLIIPNKVIYFGIVAACILRLFSHPLPLWNYVAAFAVGGGLLYSLAAFSYYVLKKEGVGGGDIKLLAFLGLVLGIKLILITIFLASLIGLIAGLIRSRGLSTGNQVIPFGPFIAIGALISYFWGEGLWTWYLTVLTG